MIYFIIGLIIGFFTGVFAIYKYINYILKTNYPDTTSFQERLKKTMDDLD